MLWNKIGSSNFNYHPPACLHVLSVCVGEKEGTFSDRSIKTENAAIQLFTIGGAMSSKRAGSDTKDPWLITLKISGIINGHET